MAVINTNNNLEKFADFITGTCLFMCPEKERLLRERENLLHRLEKADSKILDSRIKGRKTFKSRADPDKTVKCFSRSAAGHKTPDPSDLRPAPVLKNTVDYLLKRVAAECLGEKSWVERYQFVADRLRAVRQDMVIQNLPPADSIDILEPIVRFHCYSAYRLCEESMNNYDPKLNSTHLQECIKRLLVLYDFVAELDGEEASKSLRNQSEFELLYLSLNLGDVSAITRALQRNSCDKLERLGLELSLAWLCGNYIRVGRILGTLPPLSLCAVSTQMPFLRRQALGVMTAAFSSKVLKVPLPYLETILKWPDTKEAIHECTYYGLSTSMEKGETFVSFLKGDFKNNLPELPPQREQWIEEILQKYDFKNIMFPLSVDQEQSLLGLEKLKI